MEQELEYLYGLERFGIKPGLAVMERMMHALQYPDRSFRSIHVAGTNGKGSTCAMIESILRHAGYKTALYTSPHLHTFHERVRVGGAPITNEALLRLIAEIRTVCERHSISPTFFEFTTALAFLHFSRSNIDIAVIEAGMGGRYDATNVIEPIVSVITNIGLDHMEFLGSTKQEIAKEKAGIIKEGVPVVTAEEHEDVLRVFAAEAEKKHAPILRTNDTVHTDLLDSGLTGQEVDVDIQRGETGIFRVHLPLLGLHQVANMATAIAAVLQLGDAHVIDQAVLADGIMHVTWDGRLQVVSQNPLVIVDGAHNADGVYALECFLHEQHLSEKSGVLLFAAKKGRNADDSIERVVPLFHTVVITEGAYMPESADALARQFARSGKRIISEPDVGRAIAAAMSHLDEGEMMLVTGSLYMIPEVLQHFQGR